MGLIFNHTTSGFQDGKLKATGKCDFYFYRDQRRGNT